MSDGQHESAAPRSLLALLGVLVVCAGAWAFFGAKGFRLCSRAPLALIFAGDSASARIEDVVADCPLDAAPATRSSAR